MHELSLVMNLIEQVDRALRSSGEAGPVRRVGLAVGRLSGVNGDAMRFAFDAVKDGTCVAGADLSIEQRPAACECRGCGAETPIDELCQACPACGSREVAITGGRELLLQAIEVDD